MSEARASVIPTHVAIIPDGNRRWAKARGLAPSEGHRVAYDRAFDVAEAAAQRGVKFVTVYFFSTENWKRAQDEVGFLMSLMERFVLRELERLTEKGFRVRFFGSEERLSRKLVEGMANLEERTRDNTRMTLNMCFNYGGRRDLVEAVQGIVRDGVAAEQIDEAVIEQHLSSHDTPAPDLVIRTSGEQRLSNFLLWEVAYAELLFMDCYWPDFGEHELDVALAEFTKRKRRHGA